MKHTAAWVLPPHPVRSPEKVQRIRNSYFLGLGLVPPIVVLRRGDDDWAVTGSHRTAALAKDRPNEPVVTGRYFIVIDGEELLREAYEAEDANLVKLLSMLFQGDLGEEPEGYHRLVDELMVLVDRKTREALAGQGTMR